MMDKKFFVELIKYGIVGVINTLITALVIWAMMRFILTQTEDGEFSALSLSISNFVGYAAGVINSFIWNRNWTFKSNKSWKKEFLVFIGMFFLCYIPQLLLVNFLNTYVEFPLIEFSLPGHEIVVNHAYICQLIGIVFFTIANFLCNKYFTFKKKEA